MFLNVYKQIRLFLRTSIHFLRIIKSRTIYNQASSRIINFITLDCVWVYTDALTIAYLTYLRFNCTFLSEFSTKWKAEVRTWNLTGQYPCPIQRVRNLNDRYNNHRKCNNCNNQCHCSKTNSSSNSNNSQTMLYRKFKIISSNCPRISPTTTPKIQHIYVVIRRGPHRTRFK